MASRIEQPTASESSAAAAYARASFSQRTVSTVPSVQSVVQGPRMNIGPPPATTVSTMGYATAPSLGGKTTTSELAAAYNRSRAMYQPNITAPLPAPGPGQRMDYGQITTSYSPEMITKKTEITGKSYITTTLPQEGYLFDTEKREVITPVFAERGYSESELQTNRATMIYEAATPVVKFVFHTRTFFSPRTESMLSNTFQGKSGKSAVIETIAADVGRPQRDVFTTSLWEGVQSTPFQLALAAGGSYALGAIGKTALGGKILGLKAVSYGVMPVLLGGAVAQTGQEAYSAYKAGDIPGTIIPIAKTAAFFGVGYAGFKAGTGNQTIGTRIIGIGKTTKTETITNIFGHKLGEYRMPASTLKLTKLSIKITELKGLKAYIGSKDIKGLRGVGYKIAEAKIPLKITKVTPAGPQSKTFYVAREASSGKIATWGQPASIAKDLGIGQKFTAKDWYADFTGLKLTRSQVQYRQATTGTKKIASKYKVQILLPTKSVGLPKNGKMLKGQLFPQTKQLPKLISTKYSAFTATAKLPLSFKTASSLRFTGFGLASMLSEKQESKRGMVSGLFYNPQMPTQLKRTFKDITPIIIPPAPKPQPLLQPPATKQDYVFQPTPITQISKAPPSDFFMSPPSLKRPKSSAFDFRMPEMFETRRTKKKRDKGAFFFSLKTHPIIDPADFFNEKRRRAE